MHTTKDYTLTWRSIKCWTDCHTYKDIQTITSCNGCTYNVKKLEFNEFHHFLMNIFHFINAIYRTKTNNNLQTLCYARKTTHFPITPVLIYPTLVSTSQWRVWHLLSKSADSQLFATMAIRTAVSVCSSFYFFKQRLWLVYRLAVKHGVDAVTLRHGQ